MVVTDIFPILEKPIPTTFAAVLSQTTIKDPVSETLDCKNEQIKQDAPVGNIAKKVKSRDPITLDFSSVIKV